MMNTAGTSQQAEVGVEQVHADVTLLVAPLLDRLDERQTAVNPFTLLFALILMNFVDIPVGLLSVGAIDFGIIVDGGGSLWPTVLSIASARCVVTARGGIASPAALVARGGGKCWTLSTDCKTLKEGDIITLNGTRGIV